MLVASLSSSITIIYIHLQVIKFILHTLCTYGQFTYILLSCFILCVLIDVFNTASVETIDSGSEKENCGGLAKQALLS